MDSKELEDQMKAAIASALESKKAKEQQAKLEIDRMINSESVSGGEV